MSKVLIQFVADWADEFNVYGFAIMDKNEWDEHVSAFKEKSVVNGFWFGTNEGWESEEIDSDKESWLRNYKAKEINDNELSVIKTFFGDSYGNFPYLLDLVS